MINKDYYEILGVPRDADDATIKKTFKKLAIKFHPDKNPDDAKAEIRFKEASEAYQVLSDPDKRATYDRFGHEGLRGQGFQGFHGFDDIFSNMGSIFEDLFGGFGGSRRQANGPRRGRDLQYDLEVELEEAVFGTEKKIEVRKYASCLNCKGSGVKPGSKPVTCPVCNGAGQVRRTSGFFSIQTSCGQCGGAGKIISDPCEECQGAGKVIESAHVNVKIPAGIDYGMKMRIAGKGEDGFSGGPAGDLYVVIHTKPHDFLERHGNDLIMRLPISMVQAAMGAQHSVPTLDGDITLNIPKATQHQDVIRVKSKGVPHIKGYGRGDLLVEVHVQIPKSLTKRQEELLREFAEIEGDADVGKAGSFFDKIKHFATGE